MYVKPTNYRAGDALEYLDPRNYRARDALECLNPRNYRAGDALEYLNLRNYRAGDALEYLNIRNYRAVASPTTRRDLAYPPSRLEPCAFQNTERYACRHFGDRRSGSP